MAAFLRNCWYMAAWSDEVGDALFRRRIIGEPILLYRKTDGEVAALTDRCSHRFAPLSMGELQGDCVRCPYHGLVFDNAGTCIASPFSESPPKGAAIRAWPVEERHGAVWLWAGEASAADPSQIPDFSALARPCGPPLAGMMPMNAGYEFGTDNLMDLSHIEFVHKGSFAGAGVIFAGRHRVRQDGETLHSDWWMPDVAAPAHTLGVYPPEMRCDHWLDMRWNAPAAMLLEVGATPTGAPRDQGCIVWQAHILTPENETTTHYFWATTRAADHVDPQGDAFLRGLMQQAFEGEDKPIIEAAFANLDGGDFWSQRPVALGIDAGGTRARRMIEAMLRRERQPQPA
ncbi:aromatic ring-hydroxylating dioxygenase subunit alpha [Sphingomonas sp. MMSM20]|uniref:aromatic ring-hydroxylating dioxygenase subunit alpha n=1 Tax=Sphingomonas lycopersici TaxID=2951807 RepID=UPI0022380C2D|nr:aromatic ring-hydroxylating dioxygenase subunit alpha [Sphingomonas lycopersici]MCW6528629.1 aromatic ring-hydroxylating dioxygenase subunit alpha [Sphingomonas lycopersici]